MSHHSLKPEPSTFTCFTLRDRKIMAAACGKLQHMFDTPLPDNPTLMESLSWNHIMPKNNHVHESSSSSSLTEIFGELYFKEVFDSPSSMASSSPASSTDVNQDHEPAEKHGGKSRGETRNSLKLDSFSSICYTGNHKYSDSFSSMSSESLQLCTEGLGFESSDNSDDLETQDYWKDLDRSKILKHPTCVENMSGEIRRPSRVRRGPFPPPISCIGQSGKPWVCFKSYKQNGRFVLKEMLIPNQECLHASREDGRLKLHFVHKDDDCDYPTVFEDQNGNIRQQEDG